MRVCWIDETLCPPILPITDSLAPASYPAGLESHFPSRGVLAVLAGDGRGGDVLVVTLGGATSGAAGAGGSTSGSSERAHVTLEGPVNEAYFRVREVIYAQFGVC